MYLRAEDRQLRAIRMKATAIAPANIACIKYWGRSDEKLRLPLNSSISMNLSNMHTTTTVEFSSSYKEDQISMIGGSLSQHEKQRILDGIQRIRTYAKVSWFARIMTRNSFPKGAGAAASASGFAALTVAGFKAAGKNLSEKELSIFSRMGSGSACRSIPDGFVLWEKGDASESSYAHSLFPHTYWDLCDIFVIIDMTMKKVSSSEGQINVQTSPWWKKRIDGISQRIEQMEKAFQEKKFQKLGELIEEDCLSMHQVMQTQVPPLYYWNNTTKKLMKFVKQWRTEGISVYFTIDAGPNVHLICEKPTVEKVKKKLTEIDEVKNIIINTPAPGAHLIDHHLF